MRKKIVNDDPEISSFRCYHCLDMFLKSEIYASLENDYAIICGDCRAIQEEELFEQLGEFKLNELINKYGSKMDWERESDIPAKTFRYNDIELEDLDDLHIEDYNEDDR